jgi:hypothetical protein
MSFLPLDLISMAAVRPTATSNLRGAMSAPRGAADLPSTKAESRHGRFRKRFKLYQFCKSSEQTLRFPPPDLTTSDRTFWHADDQDSQQHALYLVAI